MTTEQKPAPKATPEQAGSAALAGYNVIYDARYGGYLAVKDSGPSIDSTIRQKQDIAGCWGRAEAWFAAWEHMEYTNRANAPKVAPEVVA